MTFCYRWWWPSAHLCWRSTPLESAKDAAGDEGEAEQGEHNDRADAQLGDRHLLLPSQVNLSSQRVFLLPGDDVIVNNITRVICIKTFASIFYLFFYFFSPLLSKWLPQSPISTHWAKPDSSTGYEPSSCSRWWGSLLFLNKMFQQITIYSLSRHIRHHLQFQMIDDASCWKITQYLKTRDSMVQ